VLPLLIACSTPAPPAPAPAACAVTAEQVGVPGGRIEDCTPLRGFPEILQVRVDGRGHTVVLVSGAPVSARGGAALAGFLHGLPAERAASLDLPAMIALLRAFEAFPPRFDATSAGFDLPAIGTTRFTARPFELVLYAGLPPEERFRRATLAGEPLTWTIEERTPTTPWAPVGTVPLDVSAPPG
jgi:hypothetical protein